MYEAINEIFDPHELRRTVAKGMNMLDRGEAISDKWSRFADPVAVGLDAARFDQHISSPMLLFEHMIYQLWLDDHDPPDMESFKWLARHQLKNIGIYKAKDGKIKYETVGCRMSGDMNTSCGNILIMCALLWTYIRTCNLQGQVEVLNDGDDSVIILERRNLDNFLSGVKSWFHKLGFTMSLDGIYYSLEEIVFCQARPVKLERGWTLVPNPAKRLFSDLVTTKPIHSKKVYNKWLGSVAGCGLAGSAGVPVFNSFYKWLARGANPYIPSLGSIYYRYRQELVNGMKMKARDPTWQERISFYFAYGITPGAQVIIERYYDDKPDPLWSPVAKDEELFPEVIQTMDGPLSLLDTHFKERYRDLVV
jgi:hypothetical protein